MRSSTPPLLSLGCHFYLPQNSASACFWWRCLWEHYLQAEFLREYFQLLWSLPNLLPDFGIAAATFRKACWSNTIFSSQAQNIRKEQKIPAWMKLKHYENEGESRLRKIWANIFKKYNSWPSFHLDKSCFLHARISDCTDGIDWINVMITIIRETI